MTIVISILSPFIAVILTHYFTISRMKKNDLSALKITAYTDFIQSVTKLASLRRIGNTQNDLEDLALLNDAKNRIIVCGDIPVIKELSNFWEQGATLELESGLQAYRRLTQAMRTSVGYRKFDIFKTDIDVSNLLFNIEPSRASFRAETAINTTANKAISADAKKPRG